MTFALLITVILLQILDGYTTQRCIQNGTCHEANKLVAYLIDKFGMKGLWGVKIVASVVLIFVYSNASGIVVNYAFAGLIAMYSYVVYNNYRIGSRK